MTAPTRPPTVLVVDDDADSAAATENQLKTKGFDVLVAHDGAEALSVAMARHPDLILLDVHMPALDGHEVLSQLKRRRIPTRVIVYTGSAQSTDEVVRAMKAGACAYLSKAATSEVLLAQVKRAIALEPTLDHGHDVTAEELEPKLTALQTKVGRLEREKMSLEQHLRNLEREYAGLRRRATWTAALVNVAYLVVAVLAGILLSRVGPAEQRITLAVLVVLLFLLLLLPMGKVRVFSARLLRSEARVEMHRDSIEIHPHSQSRRVETAVVDYSSRGAATSPGVARPGGLSSPLDHAPRPSSPRRLDPQQ